MRSLLLIICCLTSGILCAQGRDHDMGVWLTAGLSPRMPSHWQSSFSLEFRSKDNVRSVDLYSAAGTIHYKANQYIKIGLGYEFFLNQIPDKGLETEQRFYAEAVLQESFYGFTLSWRPRIQDTYISLNQSVWELRNRLKLSYSFAKLSLSPHISIEPHHGLQNNFSWNKTRYVAGCVYSYEKKHDYELYYLSDVYEQKPFTRHVIGVSYQYSF